VPASSLGGGGTCIAIVVYLLACFGRHWFLGQCFAEEVNTCSGRIWRPCGCLDGLASSDMVLLGLRPLRSSACSSDAMSMLTMGCPSQPLSLELSGSQSFASPSQRERVLRLLRLHRACEVCRICFCCVRKGSSSLCWGLLGCGCLVLDGGRR
jgi:hypothetical protein